MRGRGVRNAGGRVIKKRSAVSSAAEKASNHSLVGTKAESPDYRGQRGENGIAKPHFRDPGSSQPVGYPASCRNSGIARSKPRS